MARKKTTKKPQKKKVAKKPSKYNVLITVKTVVASRVKALKMKRDALKKLNSEYYKRLSGRIRNCICMVVVSGKAGYWII